MARSLRDVFGHAMLVKISSYLSADVREALSVLHEEHHVPIAKMLDTAVRDFFVGFTQRHKREGPRSWLAGADRVKEHRKALADILECDVDEVC